MGTAYDRLNNQSGGRAGRAQQALDIQKQANEADAQYKNDALTQRDSQFQDDLGFRRQQLAQNQSQFDAIRKQNQETAANNAISALKGGLSNPPSSTIGQPSLTTQSTGLSSAAASQYGVGSSLTQSSSNNALTSGVYQNGNRFSDRPGLRKGGVIGDYNKDDGSDKVPVVAREGEFFLNPETVAHIGSGDYSAGVKRLNQIIREATGQEPGPEKMGNGAQGFASGGAVQGGTGAELAKQDAIRRARDFAAGKISEAEYAATLGAPDLGYQDNSISAKPVPTPSFSFLPKPEAERQLEARGDSPSSRALTAGISSAKFAAAQSQGDLRRLDDASTPISERAAMIDNPNALSKAARAVSNPSDRPAMETANDVYSRHKAADVYRTAWQDRLPNGMRSADSDAVTLYNAEQNTRGTGIQAKRGANGVMEFSDGGPRAAQYVDANGNPTNDWRDTSQYRDAIVRQLSSGDSGLRRQGLAAAAQLMQMDASRSQKTSKEGIDAREAGRISNLRDAYMAEPEGSPKREQIGRALLMLQGKEPEQTRFQVATNEDLIDPANPMLGTRKTAYVIDPRTGQGRPVTGGGQQADPRQQEGARLQGKDGKTYVVRNGVPVPE